MLSVILACIAAVCAILYIWQQRLDGYWKRQHVKYISAVPILGNMQNVVCLKRNLADHLWQLYKTPAMEKEPIVGMHAICRPALLLRDAELVKRILIKDFNSFSNRFLKADPHHDPLGNYNLFFIRNPEWRELRSKISPVFTSGKIKQIYPLMQEVGTDLESYLDESGKSSIMELKSICARFTTDLIATVAFGIKANSIKNPNSEFYMQCSKTFELTFRRFLDILLLLLVPGLTALLRVKLFSHNTVKFLRDSVKQIMEERERNGTIRNDLIDTLIDMKRKALQEPDKPNLAMNFDYLVAQAAVFQTAGYETSSAAMCFGLYELSRQPELQDRLRAEIREAAEEGDGTISYKALHEMTYLGQVLDETLRMYPSLAFIERECTPEPGSAGYSLKPYSDFVVPADMPIYVSIIGIQRDEKYWPNPHHFDPERFAPENRDKINKDAYLPFGTGPHNCIGMRLGLLQSKLGLVHLLKNHRVVKCDKTPDAIRFDAKSFNITNQGGIYMRIERVDN